MDAEFITHFTKLSHLKGFGIYHTRTRSTDEDSIIDAHTHSVPIPINPGTREYYSLMNTRADFFVYILEEIQTGFIFMDADIIFFRDPLPWIIGNHGSGAFNQDILNQNHKKRLIRDWTGIDDYTVSQFSLIELLNPFNIINPFIKLFTGRKYKYPVIPAITIGDK